MTRATVTQVTPLRVRIDGATSDSSAHKLTSATFVLTDRVWVDQDGARLFVHGKVVD